MVKFRSASSEIIESESRKKDRRTAVKPKSADRYVGRPDYVHVGPMSDNCSVSLHLHD